MPVYAVHWYILWHNIDIFVSYLCSNKYQLIITDSNKYQLIITDLTEVSILIKQIIIYVRHILSIFWHLGVPYYVIFTSYIVFSATPFCLRKYFNWKGVHRTYKLYYAMLKIIKMILLCNNVLCNFMQDVNICCFRHLIKWH